MTRRPLDAMHPKLIVDHRHRIAPHLAGADRMILGLRRWPGQTLQVSASDLRDGDPGKRSLRVPGLERRRRKNVASAMDAFDQDFQIVIGGNDSWGRSTGGLQRIGRRQTYLAAALRAQAAGVQRHAVAVELGAGVVDRLAAGMKWYWMSGVAAPLQPTDKRRRPLRRRCWWRSPLLRQQKLQGRHERPEPATLAVERQATPRACCKMLTLRWSCKFLPTPGSSCRTGYAGAAQISPAGPMPDSKQKLRRVEGAGGKHDLARRRGRCSRLRRRAYSTPAARPCSISDARRHASPVTNSEIFPLLPPDANKPRRRAAPLAVLLRHLEQTAAILLGAVEVGVERESGLRRGLDERMTQRIGVWTRSVTFSGTAAGRGTSSREAFVDSRLA